MSPQRRGPLLIAPAIITLFLVNIFPLMWSFGLSFFAYKANRLAPPVFIGLKNYADVLTDPEIWERFRNTADHRRRQRRAATDRRLPAGVAVRAGISAAALSSDACPFADDVVAQRRRGFLQTLLRPDARLYQPDHLAVHARHLCHSVDPGAGDDRHRCRRRVDVVAFRDAAGARRPGERAEISLRGG